MKRQFNTALALSLAAVIHLGAADFDVNNVGDFQTALSEAAVNVQADTIHVEEGTYNISTTLTYNRASGENYSLTIQGAGADSTILDGNSIQIMSISTRVPSEDEDEGAADITIRGITFQNGNGIDGGGLFVETRYASVTVEDSNFSKNSAIAYGGGISWVSADGTITLTNNIFSANLASNGGGLYAESDMGSIILTNNIINNNFADIGGGVAAFTFDTGSITLANNIFSGNFAIYSGGGALVYSGDSNAILTNNTFRSNSAKVDGGGADIFGCRVALTNNIFSGNSANDGGGVRTNSFDNDTFLTNNTFYGNSAFDSGGGVFIYYCDYNLNIFNNIIWGNTAGVGGNDGNDLYVNNRDILKLYNNNLGPNADFDTGQSEDLYITNTVDYDHANNRKLDPGFVNAGIGDFHLLDSSLLIDEGNDTAPWLPLTDFEGDNRVIDGNGNGIAMPDIGADEYVTIAYILTFFDKAVRDGDIVGVGSGNSAERRRNAFRNMLLEAEAAGMTLEACEQLHSAYIHCDGKSKPNDFVSGSASEDLTNMIQELMNSMGCSPQ